jgi:spoIIIJ-associated protein
METVVERIVQDLLSALGVSFSAVSHSSIAGQTIFSIQTDAAPALIGGRGDTIHAIDYLVKKIYEKQHPTPEGEAGEHFLIDVNDYQVKRIKELQTKALMMADRARSFQYDVELSPMSAYERLIVHTTLQDQPNIKTESQGEGRNRRVVIKYAAS